MDLTFKETLKLKLGRSATWLATSVAGLSSTSPIARTERNILYANHAGVPLALDIYVPNEARRLPVVMLIHGGGFILGDKLQLDHTCRFLASAGFLVFNISYRFAPEHPQPAQLDDCVAALGWVKEHAESYGGDPARICVGGGSAGAHLSAMLGTFSQHRQYALSDTVGSDAGREIDCSFQAALLLNGLFDVETGRSSGFPNVEFLMHCYMGGETATPELNDACSPLRHVRDSFPPTFLAVGTEDPLRGESIAMNRALRAAGVAVESREYPGSTHAFFNWFWTKNSRDVHEHMLAWLRKVIG